MWYCTASGFSHCTTVHCEFCLCVLTCLPEVYSDMLLFTVTSHRNGPNWRGKREPLGQWGGMTMLPAASTMGMMSLYYS